VALSVLIPVRTGPPDAAAHAMRSVLYQPIEERALAERNDCGPLRSDKNKGLFLSPMQIVLVDDRCEDGSIDAMILEARKIADLHRRSVDIAIHDYRNPDDERGEINGDDTLSRITIDIVCAGEEGGVGAALNRGLQTCRSEFIARMDADDISAPGRFSAQLHTLKNAPSLDVLGTSSVLFSTRAGDGGTSTETTHSSLLPYPSPDRASPNQSSHEKALYCSLPSTDAGFVAWSLLFSCVVSHPTAMYRRSAVLAVGGYRTASSTSRRRSVRYTEDYDLWVRLTGRNVRCVSSLPRLGLWHRKHGDRYGNDERKRVQREESLRVSTDAVSRVLGIEDDDGTAVAATDNEDRNRPSK